MGCNETKTRKEKPKAHISKLDLNEISEIKSEGNKESNAEYE